MSEQAASNQPYALLREIEQRALQRAKGLPLQVKVKNDSLVIGFKIGEHNFVTPVDEVAELLTFPQLSRVPGTKSWVCGVANIRGNLLPIMDLQDYLLKKPTTVTANSRVLVVNHEGVFSGLLVDAVLGLRHFLSENRNNRALPDVDDFIKSYLAGSFIQENEQWGIFSMHALAKSPLFLQVAV